MRGSNFPAFYLQTWVRDASGARKTDLAGAIAALSNQPARAVALNDRGQLSVGYRADINVIDLDRLRLHAPSVVYDLPVGGRRLNQGADGYAVTIKIRTGHVPRWPANRRPASGSLSKRRLEPIAVNDPDLLALSKP
jgi:N-acyl-D-aspartate/D-glutamate deacylase